jgi:cysteine dioxygenase
MVEEGTDYTKLLDKIRFSFKDIEHLCFWDSDDYSKINVGSGDNFKIDLICWENDQESVIHDHSEKEAWTYIIKGELTEKRFEPVNGYGEFNLIGQNILAHRKTSCLKNDDNLKHKLINSFQGRSVSLHLYLK